MDEGRQVLQWADENQYSLAWIAKQIGYSAASLYEALHHDRISRELADALFERFGIRVVGSELPRPRRDGCQQPC